VFFIPSPRLGDRENQRKFNLATNQDGKHYILTPFHINNTHQIWPRPWDIISTIRILKFTIVVEALLVYITMCLLLITVHDDPGKNKSSAHPFMS
jgi:hypothetical protein